MADIERAYPEVEPTPEESDIFLGVGGAKPNPIVEVNEDIGAWLLSDAVFQGPAPALVDAFEKRRQNLARTRNAR